MRKSIAAAALVAAVCAGLTGCGSDTPPAAAQSPSPSPSATSSGTADPHEASTTVGALRLTDFWVKQSSLDMSAGFGEIENTGSSADALVKVEAEGVPVVELHQTTNNVMAQVDSFPIPAGDDLALEPGGNHLMFLGLTDPLVPGDTVDLTLTFQSGATAALTVPVVAFTGDDGHEHSDDE